jgi:hypothetical protein
MDLKEEGDKDREKDTETGTKAKDEDMAKHKDKNKDRDKDKDKDKDKELLCLFVLVVKKYPSIYDKETRAFDKGKKRTGRIPSLTLRPRAKNRCKGKEKCGQYPLHL